MLCHLPLIAEVTFARVAPGVFNLLSIVLLGRYLEVGSYGIFSTSLATIALIALVVAGPVRFSIIPQRATYEAKGEEQNFEQGALSLLLLTSFSIGFLGLALWFSGIVQIAWVALAIASSLSDGWMPVLRARLQFWRYGFVAWTKSIVILLLIYFLVAIHPTSSNALWAYALGNAFGFLVGWILSGARLPGRIERMQLKAMLSVGSSFTLSKFAENGLFLGTRYIILWLGSAEFLGLFTYAIDLVQRSVGVVINVLSFAIVPRAYKLSALKGTKELFAYLRKSGMLGASMSVIVFLPIFLLHILGVLETLLGRPLPLTVFTLVSVAVVTNRLKRMVVDPIAVALRSHLTIPAAYILIAPFSLGLSAWLAYQGQEDVITYIYPASYLFVACLAAFLVYFRSRAPR